MDDERTVEEILRTATPGHKYRAKKILDAMQADPEGKNGWCESCIAQGCPLRHIYGECHIKSSQGIDAPFNREAKEWLEKLVVGVQDGKVGIPERSGVVPLFD